MSLLILARHGNTFRPEDEPVWVGARSDLPLVEKGLLQAEELATALLGKNILLSGVRAGPLQRTRQTAEIVTRTLRLPEAVIDPRLTEIDYGAWEGKSTAAIIAAGYETEMSGWNKQSIFPVHAGWSPSEAEITADVASLLAEIGDSPSLIVTSNGVLRFFARATVNRHDFPDLKVATGNVCVMEKTGAGWRIRQWNQPPERLKA